MQKQTWAWVTIPAMDTLPSAMHFRVHNLAAHESFAPHQHPWGQLVYASVGSLMVTVDTNCYLINPKQAIWIPPNLTHYSGTFHGAAFRSFYIDNVTAAAQQLPKQTTLYTVSPFFRHLVDELERTQNTSEPEDYTAQIMSLLYAQLRRLKTVDCFLPWPQHEQLKSICQAIYQQPDHSHALDDWAKHIGVSSRSLMRLFLKDMGMNYSTWCHKLKIFLAMQWLASDKSITHIALDLGYASASAFIYRFRQELGISPQKWREEKQ